jgi:hypothetical protein
VDLRNFAAGRRNVASISSTTEEDEMGKRIIQAGLLIAATAAIAAPAAAPAAAPVQLQFSKQAVQEGVWQGTVSGDVTGALTTRLISRRVTGPIWHVTFDWIVDAGAQSFTARLSGTLNTLTGAVVMNGTVVQGYLNGAQVHEAGQLVDPATLAFQGVIRIMPATAG